MGKEATQQGRQWDGIVRRQFDISIRAIDQERRSVSVVASTDTLDSHGTILEQDWRLDRYIKNPVVLWNHNNFESGPWSFGGTVRPEDYLPIGRAEEVGVVDGQLQATLIFAEAEMSELADRIFRLFGAKMLRCVSVGFRPGTVTEELFDGRDIYRLGKNELYEISVVPIPSNPDAIAKSIAFEREHLGRIAAGRSAGGGERESPVAMTPEEKAAYDAAIADAKEARSTRERLEGELKSEKAVSTRLQAELTTTAERAVKAENRIIEVEIDKLVGVKIYPAERDEQLALAREIGIDRVQKIVSSRPDIKLTAPVRAGGRALTSAEQPAPDPAEESDRDGGDDIVDTAMAFATNASH